MGRLATVINKVYTFIVIAKLSILDVCESLAYTFEWSWEFLEILSTAFFDSLQLLENWTLS